MSSTAQLFEVLVWAVNGDKIRRVQEGPFLVLANDQASALVKGVELAKDFMASDVTQLQHLILEKLTQDAGVPDATKFFAALKTSYRGMLQETR